MVTTKQIAAATGVSRSCVSQVLNDAPNARIAPQTRLRVLTVAKRLGYRRRPAPAPRRAPTVAYVCCHDRGNAVLTHPWSTLMLASLEGAARRDGRALVYLATTDDPPAIESLRAVLQSVEPVGVILDGIISAAVVEAVRASTPHLVVCGGPHPSSDSAETPPQFDRVSIDVNNCVWRLLDHLHACGARAIALISNPLSTPFDQSIVEAYKSWHDKACLPYQPERVQVCERSERGIELLVRLRSLGIEHDGMLFGNPELAGVIAGVVEYDARFHGARPPHLAVIGTPESYAPLRRAAMCGCLSCQFASAAYELLASGINNTQRRPRHTVAPVHFRAPEL